MTREGRQRQRRRLRQQFQEEREGVCRRAMAAKKRLPPPRISLDPQHGDRVFVRRVRAAAASVSLEKAGGCPAHIADFIHWLRADGFEEVIRILRSEAALKVDHQQDLINTYVEPFREASLYVSSRIFEQLPEAYRRGLLPDYFFRTSLSSDGAVIRFGFLERQIIDKRIIHCSPARPSVTINGERWTVAFTRHAIERVCERSSFEHPIPYSHYAQCDVYFTGCVHYEPVTFTDGQPALRLFMVETVSVSRDRYRKYLSKVAGLDDTGTFSVPPAYVLGYCPLALRKPFAIATSFLYPGYDGTPEDTLVRTADIPRSERRRLLDLAAGNNLVRVIDEGNHEAIRWYHQNGVPQVAFLDRRLFDWRAGD